MPLGNGDIGLNVWTEGSGDVCFYISKTDSWDESGRLLKLGRSDPSRPEPVLGADSFLQTLSTNSSCDICAAHMMKGIAFALRC
jgi:hypothetical protein